ncbi:galactokinase family protein [Prolixibacter sp. SD074]|jgi:galactokinase|uniref:galactokinase n=1 Tax=Prolixibacter sp. SD074 TaxID=2652391 RepID=UPI001271E748|nr:galactokinase family protein [Prolixibacter sp. SD074]GET29769.1 galactokinase [Prolixibacter sp. SD074]
MAKISALIEKINGGENSLFNELYGTNAETLSEQADRYARLMDEFKKMYGQDDVELFSSPGRTEIGGNHTDHNHGRVLAGAVNLDMIAVAAKNDSNIIKIKSAGYPEFQVDLSNLGIDGSQFYTSSSLVKGICARMKENGFEIDGFNACIEGRVPKGSGLSSSASFEVLIGAIVNHLFNDGKMSAVENAMIGQWSENNFFGKPCGLMDQTACSVGGLITIDFKDPANPIVKKVDFDFVSTGFALVITDVGGGHDDPASQAEYASLPTEMKAVAAELGAKVLREVTLEQVIDKIPEIRKKTGDRAILRAIHFHGDNQRVVDQVAALEKNDFQAFLKMVVESGYSSYMYNQNIFDVVHKDEQVVSLALALSELVLKRSGAWRVHGGGFGGTIQAFVPQDKLAEYVKTLEHVYGKGKCHTLFIRSKGSIKLEL